MARFRYQARDRFGRRVTGELEAASRADAERALAERGLEPLEVSPLEAEQPVRGAGERLSAGQAEEVAVYVAELSTAQLPLAAGLRAAAGQSTSRRVARALRGIAGGVERGQAVEKILTDRGRHLPAHIRGLVAAAARTGRLGPALDELVEHHRATREVWRSIWAAVTYPLLVLGLAGFVLVFIPTFIVPVFKRMFEEFDLTLPAATELLIQWSDITLSLTTGPGIWGVLGMVTVISAGLLLGPLVIGRAHSHRFAATVPIVGPLRHWSGAAAFSRLLAVLVDHGLPLPEALRLSADGLGDANLRDLCRRLAEGVDEGRMLSDLLAETNRLPASLVPLVRWGERTGQLAEGLRVGSEMFLGRVRLRALLLRSVSPPVVFILVGLAVGFMVVSLFMPLVTMIAGLS